MVYEVEIEHSIEGTERGDLDISNLTVNIDRNQEFKGLFMSFSGDIELVDEFKTFVDNVYLTYGIDEDISIKIYEAINNIWTLSYEGVLVGSQYEKTLNKSIIGFVESGFERKLTDRLDLEIEYNTNLTVEGVTQSGFTNYFQDVLFRGLTTSLSGKAVFPFEFFMSFIQKLTDSGYVCLDSPFFGRDDATFENDTGLTYPSNGKGALILITIGAYMSGFQEKDPNTASQPNERSILAKFSDLFKEFSNIFNLGLGISEDEDGRKIAIIDELKNFYTTNIMAVVENCNNMTITYDEELFYKKIDASYTNTDDDNDGGVSDYNVTSKWVTECKFGTDLDLQNAWRTDVSGLEKAITNPLGGRIEDSELSTDNQIFLEHCYYNGANLETVRGEDFGGTITGIYQYNNEPNNVYLSPARKLLRHGDRIRIGTDNNSYESIKFQNTDSYSKLSAKYQDEDFVVNETEDYPTNEMAEPYLSGRIFKFDCALTQSQINDLKLFRSGIIQFPNYIEGGVSYGYIKTCAIEVTKRKVSFELYESTNLSNFASNRITELSEENRLTESGIVRVIE